MQSVKILGKEYPVRSDAEPENLLQVAAYVDQTLRDLQRNMPDTQSAAILTALNIASELLRIRDSGGVELGRVQALIDLVDSV